MTIRLVLLILAISVLLQFTAAFLALRLIWITGRRRAWLFIAAGISLMAIRRSITLFDVLRGELYPDPTAELVALATSILIVFGVALIAPLFLSIKRSEKVVRKINRSLNMLTLSNQAVIRATDESTLLKDVCRTIVEVGRYRLAWIGFAEHDEAKTVRPVVYAGHEKGYLDTLKITCVDTEQGRHPASKAIRTGKHFICRNISTDPDYAPWRNEATKRGYASLISFPLIGNSQSFGSLTIYAEEPDAFDEEEAKLLTELANDLAYGIMALRSIAKRKQAEEQIKQLQEYLQLQIERMPIGLIVWDTEFHVQSWNPADEKIFGFTAGEALGKHPYDLIVPEEVQPYVDDIWHRLLEGDATAHSVNENITKDGRTIICEWSNTPLKKADGTVMGVLSMVQDVTERKEMEEALRATKERLQFLISFSPAVIYTCKPYDDYGCTFISDNVKEQLGYEPQEFIEKSSFWVDHIHPDDRERIFAELPLLFKHGHHVHGYRFQHKDGIYRWMHDELKLMRDANGTPLEIIGFWVDGTQHKKMEDELRKSEEELKKRVKELEEFYQMAVGRELKMIELKKEIEGLKEELEKYKKVKDLQNLSFRDSESS
jgi:PAS domain S-box-containing protein